MDELRQAIILMLKTKSGFFIQHPTMGTEVDVHIADEDGDFYTTEIRNTLNQIDGVSVESVTINNETFTTIINYFGDIVNFTFETRSIYEE